MTDRLLEIKREHLAKIASKSTCRRRQVGALALDANGTSLGAGFNVIANETDCLRCPLSRDECPQDVAYDNPETYCPAIHAEEFAILNAGDNWIHVRHMVVSHDPCPRCADYLRRLGIPVEVIEIPTI